MCGDAQILKLIPPKVKSTVCQATVVPPEQMHHTLGGPVLGTEDLTAVTIRNKTLTVVVSGWVRLRFSALSLLVNNWFLVFLHITYLPL